jgi:hypothetical protein
VKNCPSKQSICHPESTGVPGKPVFGLLGWSEGSAFSCTLNNIEGPGKKQIPRFARDDKAFFHTFRGTALPLNGMKGGAKQ